MMNGIAILSLVAIAGLDGLIDGGDGQSPTSPQDLLHTPPIEIYLDGEWMVIDPDLSPATPATRCTHQNSPHHPARLGRESGIHHSTQPLTSDTITRGYGIHQVNIFRNHFTGRFWATEIVRPTKPPIIEKPRTLVIERESRGGGGGMERVFVPTTNVEVRDFLEGLDQ